MDNFLEVCVEMAKSAEGSVKAGGEVLAVSREDGYTSVTFGLPEEAYDLLTNGVLKAYVVAVDSELFEKEVGKAAVEALDSEGLTNAEKLIEEEAYAALQKRGMLLMNWTPMSGYLNRHVNGLPKEKCKMRIIVENTGERIEDVYWEPHSEGQSPSLSGAYHVGDMDGYLGTAWETTPRGIRIGYHVWGQNNQEFVYYAVT